MHTFLLAALGVLLTAFTCCILFFGCMYARERARLRRRLMQRLPGREKKPVRQIYYDDWNGSSVAYDQFELLWNSLADTCRVPPELMRPGDDLRGAYFVQSDWFWQGIDDDLNDFLLDHVRGEERRNLAGTDYRTVADILNAVISCRTAQLYR